MWQGLWWGTAPPDNKTYGVGRRKRNRGSRQGGQGRFSNRVSHEQRPEGEGKAQQLSGEKYLRHKAGCLGAEAV